ncbi:type IV pilus twitching motility protein PilT [Kiloniella sp.]|uniref:type IV pilus twitching motility protein PilT n=1 Tax=Kiloniella sp. TaxID=1938587 RepID=UPI003B029CA1
MNSLIQHAPKQKAAQTPNFVWPKAAHQFDLSLISDLLKWSAEQGVSDIKIEGGQPVRIYVDGLAYAVTPYKIDVHQADQILTEIYNETGKGLIANRSAIDFSHQVKVDRFKSLRFRVCVVGTTGRERTHEITLRLLPEKAPDFDEISTEIPIRKALLNKRGLSLITGETGSGKSTLLAATIRALLYSVCGQIQTFENPIEFVFHDIDLSHSWITQIEIPTQIPTFLEALKVSMRRYPKILVVGECRDKETIEAAINAAQQGSPVYTTSHTKTVLDTIDRLVNIFPGPERDSRSIDIVKQLNIIISQRLETNPNGGRTALKEWLCFEHDLVDELIRTHRSKWHFLLREAFSSSDQNQTMQTSAQVAYDKGLIEQSTLLSILPPRPLQVSVTQEGMSA